MVPGEPRATRLSSHGTMGTTGNPGSIAPPELPWHSRSSHHAARARIALPELLSRRPSSYHPAPAPNAPPELQWPGPRSHGSARAPTPRRGFQRRVGDLVELARPKFLSRQPSPHCPTRACPPWFPWFHESSARLPMVPRGTTGDGLSSYGTLGTTGNPAELPWYQGNLGGRVELPWYHGNHGEPGFHCAA
jgi:hypothetical protein